MHRRQLVRHELPIIVLQYRSAIDAKADQSGFLPLAGPISCIVPRPVETRSIYALYWFGGIVEIPNSRGGQCLHTLIFLDFPSRVCVHSPLSVVLRGKHKAGAIANLRQF